MYIYTNKYVLVPGAFGAVRGGSRFSRLSAPPRPPTTPRTPSQDRPKTTPDTPKTHKTHPRSPKSSPHFPQTTVKTHPQTLPRWFWATPIPSTTNELSYKAGVVKFINYILHQMWFLFLRRAPYCVWPHDFSYWEKDCLPISTYSFFSSLHISQTNASRAQLA